MANVDPGEVAHFGRLASRWWDADGELRTLHDINPLRAKLVSDWTAPAGKAVVDVGCGGGLLCEALARGGARVTGIDMSREAIQVARLHQVESGLADIRYLELDAAGLAGREPAGFDVACCLELIEHVPDPAQLVASVAALLRPGGSVVFSSINRSLRAWLTAIVAGEYVTGLIPRGTHRFERLIRPGELDRWGRQCGLELKLACGLDYDPATRRARAVPDPEVNYLLHFQSTR